jgi:hypothetical protein
MAKRKPGRPKKVEDVSIEFEVSDFTLKETLCNFAKTKELMEKDGSKVWMIPTTVEINTAQGTSEISADFFSDKSVKINSMSTLLNGVSIIYCPDIRYFVGWIQENGWSKPYPHPDLITMQEGIWKHFWETGLVESSQLDKKYGYRKKFKI